MKFLSLYTTKVFTMPKDLETNKLIVTSGKWLMKERM